MGASLSRLRDNTRVWAQETEEIGYSGRKHPEWIQCEPPGPTAFPAQQTSPWEVVSSQRLVVTAWENHFLQNLSASTPFFGNYMTFPPYNSFIQQGSPHFNPSHLLRADGYREEVARQALVRLQDQNHRLQLETERLDCLLNQCHNLGVERDNLESRKIVTYNAQRYKTLLAAKETELALAQQQIEEDKITISELERLHRLDLAIRAKVAHLETELNEAKTVIAVLKDELKRREDLEFFTPSTSPKSLNKAKSRKTPVKAPNSPAPHSKGGSFGNRVE
ncbi:hypothetical protein Emag_007905 [Eimeria magna]